MVLEVKRQPKESVQSLLHRFSKGVRESGILRRARKIRFRQRTKNKQAEKASALRRQESKKRYEKLKKLGKIEE